ncbi:MAG: hypothetical protein IT440_03405 [Phycisphaeraceae bacterium]|nr:hypothetical protein [Phycisphaeraceae bacterium]
MKHFLRILSTIVVLGAYVQLASIANAAEPVSPAKPIFGMWVWKSQYITDPVQRKEMLDFSVEHGFNLLLMQIHLEPGSYKAGKPVIQYPRELTALVSEAADRNIAVEALYGEPDGAEPAQQPGMYALVDAILALNRQMPEGKRFTGIHLDIEPYVMPSWKAGENRESAMRNLLTVLTEVRRRIAAGGMAMTLAQDIPFWYNSKTTPDYSCIITWNGTEKNFHQHIQDITDYVGIMSYRQRGVGDNSAVSVSKEELEYARGIGKTVCIGLETGQQKETPQITFFGKPASYFWEQRDLIRKELASDPACAGILVHCYSHFRKLLAADAKP